jgi:hypothetical protein
MAPVPARPDYFLVSWHAARSILMHYTLENGLSRRAPYPQKAELWKRHRAANT